MKQLIPILSITGSDGLGGVGVQADIKTISAMGGYAVTAITSITIQNHTGIQSVHKLPSEVVVQQVKSIIEEVRPKAIKIGLITDAETIKQVRDEIIGCSKILCDPGILSSHGHKLMDEQAIKAFCRYLIPETSLLMLRCNEAELLLNKKIQNDDDMLMAAESLHEMGAQWVILRGGHQNKGRLTALLYGDETKTFLTSYNLEGWQKHGIGGALSSAITTRLAWGDDIPTAIKTAHEYIHSQVVYSIADKNQGIRGASIYNQLLSLIADHYQEAHDVAYYAEKLSITTRYLSQITKAEVNKSPKEIIDEYLQQEIEVLLKTTSLSIQEISSKLGFSSQVILCRFFHKRKGCSPSAYRNR